MVTLVSHWPVWATNYGRLSVVTSVIQSKALPLYRQKFVVVYVSQRYIIRRCLPDSPKPVSPKPDSPKLGLYQSDVNSYSCWSDNTWPIRPTVGRSASHFRKYKGVSRNTAPRAPRTPHWNIVKISRRWCLGFNWISSKISRKRWIGEGEELTKGRNVQLLAVQVYSQCGPL